MFKKSASELALEETILDLTTQMTNTDPAEADYAKMQKQLSKLYKLKSETTHRVSPDTWLIIGGNILGIVIITWYERDHVITSQAMRMLRSFK